MNLTLIIVNTVAGVAFTSALLAVLLYLPWQVRRSYRQTFTALARAVEAREPHLLGHAEQTARYVVWMARFRGMDFRATRQLEYAALLHGIGKVSVPYGLLNSPEPLSNAAEWFVARDYVRVGAAILDAIPILRPCADAVRFHHEYLDGSGYPFGRAGRSLPLEAQMLCVASEYVAMTAPRLYRVAPPLSAAQADAFLRAQTGRRYSRLAVSLFRQAKAGEEVQAMLTSLARHVHAVWNDFKAAPPLRRVF